MGLHMDTIPNIAEEPGFRRRMEAKEDPLKAFDPAAAYAAGSKAFTAIFRTPLPSPSQLHLDLAGRASSIRERLDRGERVAITAEGKELAVYEPHPGAVLAACLRRDFATAGRVTPAMLDAAQTLLPDVDRDALKLAIEGALRCERL